MRWHEFWEKVQSLGNPLIETEERQRRRSARVLEAEAAFHRAMAEEARSRGRTDSARERRALADSLDEEAAMVRLQNEYDVIAGSSETDSDIE